MNISWETHLLVSKVATRLSGEDIGGEVGFMLAKEAQRQLEMAYLKRKQQQQMRQLTDNPGFDHSEEKPKPGMWKTKAIKEIDWKGPIEGPKFSTKRLPPKGRPFTDEEIAAISGRPNEIVMAGNKIINAVIRAGAIDRVIEMKEHDACIVVWRTNAAEQIEAALSEAGFKLVKK